MEKTIYWATIKVSHTVITGYGLEIEASDFREATVKALDYIPDTMRMLVVSVHVRLPETFVRIN